MRVGCGEWRACGPSASHGGHTTQLIQRAFSVVVFVAALGVLAGGLALYRGDVRLQVVTSGSMRPVVSPGDVAITRPIGIGELAVGDVIAFFPPGEARPVLHRITSLEHVTAGPLITTRGDANSVDDPWQATLRGETAYRLVAVVPLVGFLAEYRAAVLIAGGLLLLVVLIRELRRKEPRPSGPSPA